MGPLYGLRPEADIWLDANAFVCLLEQGNELFEREPEAALRYFRQAPALYLGKYLLEYPYEEWSSEERERLITCYLRTAQRLAGSTNT
jgi:hypothetical protein